MDFPADQIAREKTEEYMFGPAFLVAPVTAYKARTRELYLPKGETWYDFWTGKAVAAGAVNTPAPLGTMPVFVKAGSIVPLGPEKQYISEKASDPITLFVYAGADGKFTLYEDDGETYGYEHGAFTQIPILWDEAAGTLTLGERVGQFEGMLRSRMFQVVLISRTKAVGFSFEPPVTKSMKYDGKVLRVKLR